MLITILSCFALVGLAEIIAYISLLAKKAKEDRDEKERIKKIEDERKREERAEIENRLLLAKRKEERIKGIEALYDDNISEYFKARIAEDMDDTIFGSVLGEDYSCDAELETYFKDGILWIECKMPNKDELSPDVNVNAKGFPKIYDGYLYSLCLHIIDDAFDRDRDHRADSILFNGYLFDYSHTTGKLEKRIVMSILVNRDQWQEIDIQHVDSKACFKHLKGVSAAKLIDVSPITPVLELNKEDHRFIESKDVSINEGTNLASMDWEDFEQLVRQLFELEFGNNGGEVRVTQASRDGGVDAVIFDPDPILGGKIVVQAKRYTNTVPVTAVRDLYGTIVKEGANFGILITTSNYGADSYKWANGLPIKLLNSGHLLALLQKHGLKGYINIEEAKKTLKE